MEIKKLLDRLKDGWCNSEDYCAVVEEFNKVTTADEHWRAAMAMSEKHRKNWVEACQERDHLRARIDEISKAKFVADVNSARLTGECSELRAALAAAEEKVRGLSEWRTMESAPKDGRRILLADARYKDVDATMLGRWKRGKWWSDATLSGHSIVWESATHWMPLPPLPLPKEST